MSLAAMYPALDRRNNLLRSLRAPAPLERGAYDPAVDRPLLYQLPQRARFWPGSDTLAGDEWQYWYGDIAIPEELSRPRRRPSCLSDEQALNEQLLRQMRSQKLDLEEGGVAARGRRASAGRMESAISSAEQSMEHLSRARHLRASSVSRLQATRQSMERDARAIRASSLSRRAGTPAFNDDLYADIEIPEELSRPRRRPASLMQEQDSSLVAQEGSAASRASKYLRSVKASSVQRMSSSETTTKEMRSSARGRSALRASQAAEESDYLGLDGNRVYVPRWLENHPIPDPPAHRRPPPGDVWPEKRPFYDLKNDYDAMLSYMGVTKDLKKAVSGY